MKTAILMIPAAIRRMVNLALCRFCLLCALSFLVAGCSKYQRIYEPFDGVENVTKNFEQMKTICSGEAQSVVMKQSTYIPPPPCYYPPCLSGGGIFVPGGPTKHFSQEKFDACAARHGWRFSHLECIENCDNANSQ